MKARVNDTITYLVHTLRKVQIDDGSWHYCFDCGPMTDAYMIILLRTLNDQDEKFIIKLVQRLLSIQNKNGAWTLFADEKEGNLSATIEAYYALLYSGYVEENADYMN